MSPISHLNFEHAFLCVCDWACVCVCGLQHILILIKMVLAFMIPDEPDWIREKREQIEFRSLQALGQQVWLLTLETGVPARLTIPDLPAIPTKPDLSERPTKPDLSERPTRDLT